MHPITVLEIVASGLFVLLIFSVARLMPSKVTKISFTAAVVSTLLLILFFAVRPFWVEFQVTKKTETLEEYLSEKYPGEEWEIQRQVGRQYNPYLLEVTFDNEKDWAYTYSVADEYKICQSVWTPPEGMLPNEGKHFEGACG